jgi:hypothetical protein
MMVEVYRCVFDDVHCIALTTKKQLLHPAKWTRATTKLRKEEVLSAHSVFSRPLFDMIDGPVSGPVGILN